LCTHRSRNTTPVLFEMFSFTNFLPSKTHFRCI